MERGTNGWKYKRSRCGWSLISLPWVVTSSSISEDMCSGRCGTGQEYVGWLVARVLSRVVVVGCGSTRALFAAVGVSEKKASSVRFAIEAML